MLYVGQFLRSWDRFKPVYGVLCLLGFVFTDALASGFAMASDGCFADDRRAICTESGQHVVVILPVAGWAAGAAIGFGVALLVTRKKGSPWWALPVGFVIWLAGAWPAYAIVTG